MLGRHRRAHRFGSCNMVAIWPKTTAPIEDPGGADGPGRREASAPPKIRATRGALNAGKRGRQADQRAQRTAA
jgi:hypothetical protein